MEDDMDSLFEGMVLFTPNPQSSQDQDPVRAIKPNHMPPTTMAEEAPAATESPSGTVTAAPIASEPLDEDLFSDLTLVTPSQTLYLSPSQTGKPEPTPIPSTNVSRQISKRKKRATLRIGYGRDSNSSDDHNQQQHDRAVSPHPPPVGSIESKPSSAVTGDDTAERKLTDSKDQIPVDDTPAREIEDLKHQRTIEKQEKDPTTSAAEKFELLRAQISEKLAKAGESVVSVSAAWKDSIRRRRKAAEDVNEASQRHSELEKQLEEACEAEDFETAERLSGSIATAEKAKGDLLSALRVAEAECNAVDCRIQEALEVQIAVEEECATLLDRFSANAANDADSVFTKAETQTSKEMDNWLSSTEALQVKKMELEIESHLIEEACKVMDSFIEQSIEDDLREKENLYKKKDILMDELEKLLALVREKEKEIAENDCSIEAVEQRISGAVSGFQEAKSSIEAKYNNLQSGLSQAELENESLSMRKKKIDQFIIQEEDRVAKLRELAKHSSDEAKAYQEVIGLRKNLMVSILKFREEKLRLAKTEEKLSEDVQMLLQKVSGARASLQELSSTRASVQQSITSFKERIFTIDTRVPELETEKKIAAASRNFKEAGRIAAEAKSLTVEKDGLQTDLDKANLELQKLEEDIKETVSGLQETEKLILSKEKEVAMTRFQRLLLIVGDASAERSAALELGNDGEASLFLAEAELAHSEAMKLKEMYKFGEEEFADLPKRFISMELLSKSGRDQLADLVSYMNLSAA